MEFTEELIIKIATRDDSCRVIELLKYVAQWMKDNNIDQWSFLLNGGEDEEIEQAIRNSETYIVLKNQELVATFTLLCKQSEWDKEIWGVENSSNSLYLHRLAITPAYMNLGIGKSILTWIVDNKKDKATLKLDCVAQNTKLNNFYKNNDFKLIGTKNGHSKYQKNIKNTRETY